MIRRIALLFVCTATVACSTGTHQVKSWLDQRSLGQLESLTTDLSAYHGERPALPTYVTSFGADSFKIIDPFCFQDNGQPIDAKVVADSYSFIPGERIQLYLQAGNSQQNCRGSLVVELFKGEESEILFMPVTVTIR